MLAVVLDGGRAKVFLVLEAVVLLCRAGLEKVEVELPWMASCCGRMRGSGNDVELDSTASFEARPPALRTEVARAARVCPGLAARGERPSSGLSRYSESVGAGRPVMAD